MLSQAQVLPIGWYGGYYFKHRTKLTIERKRTKCHLYTHYARTIRVRRPGSKDPIGTSGNFDNTHDRFMSSILTILDVVFLKEYPNLSGIEDTKISNPYSQEPPLQFTTIPYSHSHVSFPTISYWIILEKGPTCLKCIG
jgi:hypothetical protein